MTLIVTILLFFILICVLSLLARLRQPSLTSATYGFIGFYLSILVFGYYEFAIESEYKNGFYDIGVSYTDILAVLPYFIFFVICFSLGAIARFSRVRNRRASDALHQKFKDLSFKRGARFVLLLSFVPFIISVVGIGPENIVFGSDYLAYQFKLLKILGAATSLAIIPVLGYYVFRASSSKFLAALFVLVFILYTMLFFSMGSRRFVISPILFFIGGGLSGGKSRKSSVFLVLTLLCVPWLLQIPLNIRRAGTQGLIPALTTIFSSDAGTAAASGVADPYVRVLLNIFFGLPLSAYVLAHSKVVAGTLLPSLDPLPGSLIGIDKILQNLRVNEYIPFNAVGELIAHGVVVIFIISIALGYIFASSELYAYKQLKRGRIFRTLTVIGLLYLTTILSTQYNLRAAIRPIYYIFGTRILLFLTDAFFRGKKRI